MESAFSLALKEIFDAYKASVADGKLTITEILTLMYNAAATIVRLIEQLGENGPKDGGSKKQLAIDALAKFYDEVVAPIDIKSVPNFIEPFVDSSLRSLLLMAAEAAIDSAVALFNKLGWESTKPVVNAESSQLPAGFQIIDNH